jgi:hypothetical protein
MRKEIAQAWRIGGSPEHCGPSDRLCHRSRRGLFSLSFRGEALSEHPTEASLARAVLTAGRTKRGASGRQVMIGRWMGALAAVGAVGICVGGCGQGPSSQGPEPTASASAGIHVGPGPEVDVPQNWTVISSPATDGDLGHYFPSDPGSNSGGWTTGECGDSFCQTDEWYSTWVGPNVPELGSSCRAAEAWMELEEIITHQTYLTPYSPPARAAGIIPTKQVCECVKNPVTGEETCWEPANVYVICPWAPDDNLDGRNPYGVPGIAPTQYFHFEAGSPNGTAQGISPTATTNGVVYEIDPQCADCVGGAPCKL